MKLSSNCASRASEASRSEQGYRHMATSHKQVNFPFRGDLFWSELLFAWGTMLVSISLATGIYAVLLTWGCPMFCGVVLSAVPMSVLAGGTFIFRQERRRRVAHRSATSPHAEIEGLLQALEKLSSDDRQKVVRRVLDRYSDQYNNQSEQEHRIRLFGLYLLGCIVFMSTALSIGHRILEHFPVNPLLDIALIISAGVVVEMLLYIIRSFRMRVAELILKRLLDMV
jgi:hypothetical protein